MSLCLKVMSEKKPFFVLPTQINSSGTLPETLCFGQIRPRFNFLAINTQDGEGTVMLWDCFSSKHPENLVSIIIVVPSMYVVFFNVTFQISGSLCQKTKNQVIT
ncbi:hypothetical protein CHARACLAT_004610 [Characodon lateralis]|uniref:Uncharacterized protein n=1 Tax=Characodon lateralis TaxID=208331 RepID=A0ABU7F2K0_9TELE|nr:hypothetical protein [Characodon lateralis]